MYIFEIILRFYFTSRIPPKPHIFLCVQYIFNTLPFYIYSIEHTDDKGKSPAGLHVWITIVLTQRKTESRKLIFLSH